MKIKVHDYELEVVNHNEVLISQDVYDEHGLEDCQVIVLSLYQLKMFIGHLERIYAQNNPDESAYCKLNVR